MRPAARFALALLVAASTASAASAAVTKYRMLTINIQQSPDLSPPLSKSDANRPPYAPFDATFIDDSAPGSPVLKKIAFKSHSTTTVAVPGAGGSGATIFIASNFIEGPGPLGKPQPFVGTGGTASGSTIRWGIVTGWTITGQQWCNSNPPTVCNLAEFEHQSTVEPYFQSDFYDLGTWFFHSTGFTSVAFVHQYFTAPPGNFGNNMRWVRGFPILDATVPALPLLGVALLGGSLVVGGLVAFGRKRS